MTTSNTTESLYKNWIEVVIGDVVENRKEKAMPDQLPNAKFIGMDCIAPNAIKPSFLYNFSDYKSAGNVFRFDDVLYGRLRPYLNKVYKAEIEGVCSGEFIVLIPFSVLFSKYLLYNLHSKKFVDFANLQVTGERPRITFNKISKYVISLPPLSEQRTIVSKIEQLFSDLDNGIENFKKAQEQLKIYRQAVLKRAFEGELTKKWREEQTDLPSADELLQHVKEEREKHYQKQLDEWKKAVKDWEDNGKEGKKLSRPKKPKELPPLSDAELKELPELPEKWCWIKVDKLLEHDQYSIKAGPFGSALKKQFYVKSGYKIYGQEQVISGNPYFGDYYIDNNKYNELLSCAIKPQDILISLVGTVGKVLVLPDNIEHGIINPRLIKISLNESFYKTIFFKYYFESMFLKSLYKIHAHGATMEIINLGIIQDLPFPFCSTKEQNQIVCEIETRLSVCDKMETTIAEALQKSEALRQSVLKKAFEGKLLSEKELEETRNAPDWEPAEKLFERIKAEKTNIKTKNKDKK